MKEYDFKKPKTHVILSDTYISLIRGTHDLTIHKALRGETKIFFSKILEIKYKKPTLTSTGYIQFCTPRTSLLGMARTVDQPQNAIYFNKKELSDVEEIKEFIESKL
ncbi:MAG TPA: hypothetical protein IAB23_12605 [Candidatus Scybalocola faecavium]|nr:hypothetical protein [Candidatus Scybalocola faecavium]